MILYIAKLVICSAVFYLYYFFFLRNNKFHAYNRMYLLSVSVLSLLIPLVKFEWFYSSKDDTKIWQMILSLYQARAPTALPAGISSGVGVSYTFYILCIVWLFTAVLLFLFGRKIWLLRCLRKKYPLQKMNGFNFISTDLPDAPFSFLKDLFWRKDLLLEEEAAQAVLKHELAHIQQKHSWDRIFMQILRAVCWYNPVFYFIEKELILVHEYIADREAINNADGKAFARMLLISKIDTFSYAPAQSIFYSSIKKRLQMLTKNQKTQFSYARRLLVLPFLACIIFAFGFRAYKADIKDVEQQLQAELNITRSAIVDTIVPDSKVTITNIKVPASEDGTKIDTLLIKKGFYKSIHDTVSTNRKNASIISIKEQPVIVVDGKRIDSSQVSRLNNEEIKEIRIVKGKAASDTDTLYGKASKNGIIYIITKGKTEVKKDSVHFEDTPE